jgi:hypothetical protein
MNTTETVPPTLGDLLERMIAARQLTAVDARALAEATASEGPDHTPARTEEEVLRWLAEEYDVPFTSLEDLEPDREVLSLFPARLLLKDELLPLRRVNGCVEIATSRLFATQASTPCAA